MNDDSSGNGSQKTALWVAVIKTVGYLGASIISKPQKPLEDPRVDKWVKYIRNHEVIAPIIMFFLVVLAIAAVVVAIREIMDFIPWLMSKIQPQSPDAS